MRFVFWIERRCDRIDHAFDDTARERKNECAGIKRDISIRGHRDHRGNDMAEKCKIHAAAITDAIDDERAEVHRDGLWIKTGALDRAELAFGQIKFAAEFVQQKRTHNKTDRRSYQRNGAG